MEVIGKLNGVFAQNIQIGVLPTLYAAVGPDVNQGNYFAPSGFMEMNGYPKKVNSNRLSQNQEVTVNLWQISDKWTQTQFNLN